MHSSDGTLRPVVWQIALNEHDRRILCCLDAACSDFFHNSPRKVKTLTTPMLFDDCCGGSGGYQELGNGKEMFTFHFDDDATPWPLSPPSFRSAVTDALRAVFLPHARHSLAAFLQPLLQNAIANAATRCDEVLAPTLLNDLIRDMSESNDELDGWFKESVLFARHYSRDEEANNESIPQNTPAVGAHTDSGIVTVMFVRHGISDIKAFEFLCSNPVTQTRSWVSSLDIMKLASSTLSGDDDNDDTECIVCFFGEMVVPFAEFLLRRQLREHHNQLTILVQSIRSELSTAVGVHRVNSALLTFGVPSPQKPLLRCRHSYPFQLRSDPDLLLESRSRQLPLGAFTQRFLML